MHRAEIEAFGEDSIIQIQVQYLLSLLVCVNAATDSSACGGGELGVPCSRYACLPPFGGGSSFHPRQVSLFATAACTTFQGRSTVCYRVRRQYTNCERFKPNFICEFASLT